MVLTWVVMTLVPPWIATLCYILYIQQWDKLFECNQGKDYFPWLSSSTKEDNNYHLRFISISILLCSPFFYFLSIQKTVFNIIERSICFHIYCKCQSFVSMYNNVHYAYCLNIFLKSNTKNLNIIVLRIMKV